MWNQSFEVESGETIYGNAKCDAYSYTFDDHQSICAAVQSEKCEPLSHSMSFKILDVREASQRKSLQGLDNTAADGSAAFHTVEMIIDSL